MLKENKDRNYIWRYGTTKSFTEQNISRDAVAVLSYINSEKYNSDTLFKNSKNNYCNTNQNISLIEYPKAKWYKRFFAKIFGILKRKK